MPVVISNDWVPPMDIAWADFLVRIDEREIDSISRRLELLNTQATEMGRKARAMLAMHFSESRVFDWLIEQIIQMRGSGGGMNHGFKKWRFRRMLDWRNFRGVIFPVASAYFSFDRDDARG